VTGPRRPAADGGRAPAAGRGFNRVRIVGGTHRGRKIAFPDAAGLRPTGDRIRETLFNWLAPVLAGSRCLDLFAGSGVLGIEAASRGAAEVVLVESAPRVASALRQTIEELRLAERVQLVEADALQWLGSAAPVPFDVVFLDPPFAAGLMADVANALERRGWLAGGALVYLERSDSQDAWPVPSNWTVLRDKQAGQVSYALARRDTAARPLPETQSPTRPSPATAPPETPSPTRPSSTTAPPPAPSSRGPKGRGDP
jgi:16S rRNA (guanine966-N2)-methyltransferase